MTSQSFNLTQQQLLTAAAGPATTAQQQQPTSHIQVVYDNNINSSSNTSEHTSLNRPVENENVRSET